MRNFDQISRVATALSLLLLAACSGPSMKSAAPVSQAQGEMSELARYIALIARQVSSNFVASDFKSGLRCTLLIRLIPGGEVVETRILKSSGDAAFDENAVLAVRKSSPLPVPQEPRLFKMMKDIQFEFDPSELQPDNRPLKKTPSSSSPPTGPPITQQNLDGAA